MSPAAPGSLRERAATSIRALARRLDPRESRTLASEVPDAWYNPTAYYGQPPPYASGVGFVASPGSGYYDKTWGVSQNADLPKYRIMYRTVPIVHAAIDKIVQSATAKGFGLEVPRENPVGEDLVALVKAWMDKHPDLDAQIQTWGKDLLTFGTAFVEACYPTTRIDSVSVKDARASRVLPDFAEMRASGYFTQFERVHSAFTEARFDPGVARYEAVRRGVEKTLWDRPFVAETNPEQRVTLMTRGTRDDGKASALMWLKPLDPLTMRVRRDSLGNVYGAVQMLSVPPVAFDTSKIIIGTFNPTSTFYESAYGVSLLQSLIRTQESIWQIESDMLVIGHSLARPPMIFTRGSVQPDGRVLQPSNEGEWTRFQNDAAKRNAGSDLYLPAWVAATPQPSPGTTLGPMGIHLARHDQQRIMGLGVPPNLLGIPDGTNRATAHVSQADYILTVQSVQRSIDYMLHQLFEMILEPWREEYADDFVVPRVKWNPILERDEAVELDKIITAAQANLLTTMEARKMIDERGIFEIEAEDPDALSELEARRAPIPTGGDDPFKPRPIPGQPTTTRGEVDEEMRGQARARARA